MSALHIVPVTLREARAFIGEHHRHNRPPHSWKFGVGLMNGTGELRGVGTAQIPVARMLDDGLTLEITRVATDGSRNANSMIYGALIRAGKAMGYKRFVTYTLDSESGSSLKAVGFQEAARLPGSQDWARPNRMNNPSLFGDKYPDHDGEKIRWEIVSLGQDTP